MFKKTLNKKINIDFGAKQYCSKDGKKCNNEYTYFYDENGHFIIILSDVIGTDESTADEIKVAFELMVQSIKSKIDYNRSLENFNSSLLSGEETLATVDIASIDLSTGSTEFYKAGAAPSILCQKDKIKKIKSTSLPAGVLRDISFDIALVKCKVGDIIVLLTDGAISNGCDWIKDEILSFRDGNAQELAEHLCMCAQQQITDECESDITILCAILNKAD